MSLQTCQHISISHCGHMHGFLSTQDTCCAMPGHKSSATARWTCRNGSGLLTCRAQVNADDCAQVLLCLVCCQAQCAQCQCRSCTQHKLMPVSATRLPIAGDCDPEVMAAPTTAGHVRCGRRLPQGPGVDPAGTTNTQWTEPLGMQRIATRDVSAMQRGLSRVLQHMCMHAPKHNARNKVLHAAINNEQGTVTFGLQELATSNPAAATVCLDHKVGALPFACTIAGRVLQSMTNSTYQLSTVSPEASLLRIDRDNARCCCSLLDAVDGSSRARVSLQLQRGRLI